MEINNIASSLKNIINNIDIARNKSNYGQKYVNLVAVSKTKPIEAIQEAYEFGIRHFGENYVEEIIEKAEKMPKDIKWHFIGHLQSNKAKTLLKIQNLHVIESLDSIKLAEKLQKICTQIKIPILNVFVQLKTSAEPTKFGTSEEEATNLVEYVVNKCPNLGLTGLMTIGMEGEKAPFTDLRKFKEKICEKFSIDPNKIELSMGMSQDYEDAILEGATSVRVGSLIFGNRNYNK